jgi:hypothetical protein
MATQVKVSTATSDENKATLTRLFALQGITAEPTQQVLDIYNQIVVGAYRSGYKEGIDTTDWP